MGSGSSIIKTSEIECPKDYDKNNFKLILELFNKLDSNSNNILELEEIKQISNKYTINKIKLLKIDINKQQELYNLGIKTLENNKKLKIIEIEKSFEKKKIESSNKLEMTLKKIESNILTLNNMNENKKAEYFINLVSYNKKDIDFWKFFTYMKNKIGKI